MSRLRKIWALAAVLAGAFGIALSAVLGGALGTAAATGAAPAATAASATTASSTTATATTGASASAIFGCRASVGRVVGETTTAAEPAVANPDTTPCATASTSQVPSTSLSGSSSGSGSVGPAGAYTYETGALGSSTSPEATAVAVVNAATMNLDGYTISTAGPAEAQTAIECDGTALKTQASSDLDALTISGSGVPGGSETVELGGDANEAVGNLPSALSALVSITANEQTTTANSVTERLLDVKLLGSNAQTVLGEATVSVANPDICADNVPGGGSGSGSGSGTVETVTGANGTVTTVTTAGGGTTQLKPSGSVPGGLQACAPGSVLDPSDGDCVIYENGKPIFVSKPFKGPQGGTVVTLTYAKKHWHSPCFSGAGPKWALIVTKKGGHATGTPGPDRILGLGANELINGLAGNDCIDEQGGGHETIFDQNGTDREYSLKGSTRIAVGNGNDYVNAQNGGGWITTGNGRDTIYGGKGRERIDVGLQTDHIYTYKSYARLYDVSQYGYVTCGNRTDVLYAREHVASWAAKHGCRRIVHVK